MATPFVLTDFPDASGGWRRLCFTDPIEVIVAERVGNVRAALDQVEDRAAAGYVAVGFVSYDAAPAFDAALRVGERSPAPLVWFGIFAAPRESNRPSASHDIGKTNWTPSAGRCDYESAIDTIKGRIVDGAFYQVNHTIRLHGKWTADSLAAYEALYAAQPSSFGAYLDIGRFRILSVSPELFFARTGRAIETRPMKGTAPRGRSAGEDAAVAEALATSEKDRAENVMIVDLVRNDLGRIAEVGTVRVPQLCAIERHPTVWQMTSTVAARLRDDVSLADTFAALFPCGSVVGAPKIAAASWIADNEGASRGVYCGAIGVVRPGGDCVFNVAIRTLVVDRDAGTAEYGTGGGITIDSTAAGEYDELLAKAAVLRGARPGFDLLETMRLTNGEFVRRERHRQRVLASADYFDFPNVAASVDAAMDECARLVPVGDHRVRLLVSRNGSARTESVPIAPREASPPMALRCAIAQTSVSSRDPMLFHKTTLRGIYEQRRAEHPGADEVILVNERGELTECSIGNLVAEIGGERFTPPVDCGLLAGTFRDELIERGIVTERVLRVADAATATRLWLVNSLREWVDLDLTQGAASAVTRSRARAATGVQPLSAPANNAAARS